MKRRTVLLSALLLTGCTQSQIGQWLEWYEKDPAAATEFANRPEIQQELQSVTQVTRSSRLRNDHAAEWERIAQCESGGNWQIIGRNRTGTYGGGLQIRNNVWVAMGGQQFAPTADQATKEQQIHIAELILDDYGWDAWDCAHVR